MAQGQYSFQKITQADLHDRTVGRLNDVLQWMTNQITRVMGNSEPFSFGASDLTFRGKATFKGDVSGANLRTTATLRHENLPVHADNAAAKSKGLKAGQVYRTATGQMMVVYD